MNTYSEKEIGIEYSFKRTDSLWLKPFKYRWVHIGKEKVTEGIQNIYVFSYENLLILLNYWNSKNPKWKYYVKL